MINMKSDVLSRNKMVENKIKIERGMSTIMFGGKMVAFVSIQLMKS